MAELAAAAPPLVVALPDAAAAATATAPLSPAPPSPEKRACVLFCFVLFWFYVPPVSGGTAASHTGQPVNTNVRASSRTGQPARKKMRASHAVCYTQLGSR